MRRWRYAAAGLGALLVLPATAAGAVGAAAPGPPPLVGTVYNGVAVGATHSVKIEIQYNQAGMTITPDSPGLTVSDVAIDPDDADYLTFQLAVSPTVAVGTYEATLTNPDGGSRNEPILEVGPNPTVSDVGPTRWIVGERGGKITFTGNAEVAATGLQIDAGPGVSFTFVGDGEEGQAFIGRYDIVVAPGTTPGVRDLVLTDTDDGATLTLPHALTLVTGDPNPPGPVSASDGGNGLLTWTAPSAGGEPITGYLVSYTSIDPAEPYAEGGDVDADVRSYQLPSSCSGYTATVAGFSQNGIGPAGPPVHVAPAPPRPHEINLAATALFGGADLSWASEDCDPSSTSNVVTVSPPDGVVSYTWFGAAVTGLKPGTDYTLTLTSTNSAGTSVQQAAVIPAGTPSAPTGVGLSLVPKGSSTTPQLSWTPADSAYSPIASYVAHITGPGFTSDESFPATQTSGLLFGSLQGFYDAGVYTVTLRECNEAGSCSAPSAPASITAPGYPVSVLGRGSATTAPLTVTGVRAAASRPDALTVTWSTTGVSGFATYQLTLTGPLGHGRTSETTYVGSPLHTFTNLIPGRLYTIRVVVTSGSATADGTTSGWPYGLWQLSDAVAHRSAAGVRTFTMDIAPGTDEPRPILQILRHGKWLTVSHFTYDARHKRWTAGVPASASGKSRIVVAATANFRQAIHSVTLPKR